MKTDFSFCIFISLILAHLFMTIFTFGHMANNKKCTEGCQLSTTFGLGMLGIGWPFYWSWELQQHKD